MNEPMPRGVVVVEDDRSLLQWLRSAITGHGQLELLAEATDGDQVLELAADLRPDIVLLDASMDGFAGREVVSRVRDHLPWVRVVVFNQADDSRDQEPGPDQAGMIRTPDDVDVLVRHLERVVDEPRSATWRLGPDPSNVPVARRLTGEVLKAWGCDALIADAQLLVTELVTNSIVHAQSSCTVALRLNHDGLRIEVSDFDPSSPEPQPFDVTREGGRGLLIVSALSTAWGIDPVEGGKMVWADLVVA